MRSLVSLLKEKVPRRQLLPLASVTGATVVNNLVAFAVQIFAARVLGAERFGVFSLAFSVATLTGAIGDFGLNLTTIRLFNKYQEERERQTLLLGSVLSFKVALFILVALLSLPIGSVLSRSLLGNASETELFATALLTGGLLFFWTYLQSYLQSHRSFPQLTGYILAYAVFRLACLAVGYALYPGYPVAWLVTTYTVPVLLLCIIGVLPRAHKLIQTTVNHPRISLEVLQDALDYSKWVTLSSIVYISLLNIVRFILAVLASPTEVGIFSAGITFAMAFSTLNTAMRAVLFPQVTALENSQQMNNYLNRIRHMAPYYFVLTTAGIGALGALQWFVLGAKYRDALPVFFITASTFALTVFLGLGTMLVHTMMKPQIDAWVNVARLGLMVLLAFTLVPLFHALGAAVAYAVPLLAGEIWMFRYVKKKNAGGG